MPSASYFKTTSRVLRTFLPFFSIAAKKPASRSFSAIAILRAEYGTATVDFLTAPAFVRRTIKSPTGSDVIYKLPRRFLDSRNIALKRLLAEADTAQIEITQKTA